MPRIRPCLRFNVDVDVDDAVAHVPGDFGKGRTVRCLRDGDEHRDLQRQAPRIDFEIGGQCVQGRNGGPQVPFTEAKRAGQRCSGAEWGVHDASRGGETARDGRRRR